MSDLEAQAREILAGLSRPRRRAAPRSAPMLADAEHRIIEGVAAWRLGAGPAALLVHGWEDDHSLWDPLIEACWAVGRPVVALDLPGHGFSPAEMTGVLGNAEKIAAVARAFGPIDALVTHSFGGPCGVFAMEEFGLAPQRAAIIAAPIAQKAQLARRLEKYGAPADLAADVFRFYPEVVGRPIDWFDIRRAAPAMTAACLFVHSYDDDDCPIAPAQDAADLWPGAQTLFTDGLGHRDIARDAAICARIVEFLDGE